MKLHQFFSTTIMVATSLFGLSQSPDFEWAITNNALATAFPLTTDSDNNIYTASYGDISINKYDSDGNFIWNFEAIGTTWNDAYGLESDKAGSLFVTGQFCDSLDFDPSNGNDVQYCSGVYDAFIQKIDTAGNHIWVRTFGGSGYDQGIELALGNQGNVYATGWFVDTFDLNLTSGTTQLATPEQQSYCIKVDQNGNFDWVYATEYVSGTVTTNDIYVDNNENVYIVGDFDGTIDFEMGVGQDIHTSTNASTFIVKLNNAGVFQWVRIIEGDNSYGASIKTDLNGGVYACGNFQGTIDMDPGTAIESVTSAGAKDGFLLKLDANGNYLWNRITGGTGIDHTIYIDVDDAGNIYSTGIYRDLVDLDPSSGTQNEQSNGMGDIFWQCFNENGAFQWAYSAGGSASDFPNKIEIDQDWNIVTAGRFSGTVDFDPTSGTLDLSSTANSMFLHKMQPPCSIATSLSYTNGILIAGAGNSSYQWIDCGNSNLPINGETSQSFSPISNGAYAVIVTNGLCSDTSNCIAVFDVGIDDMEQEAFKVYPNPFNEYFTIELQNPIDTPEFVISNTQGKVIKQGTVNTIKTVVRMETEPSGIYFLRVGNKVQLLNHQNN